MIELIHPLISGPVLPATVLLGLVLAWSLFTILVGYGMDMHGDWPFHFHNPLSSWFLGHGDAGADHPIFHALGDALGSVVLTPTKWLNLRSVPLILWVGIFALTWWTASVIWWQALDDWLAPNPGAWSTTMMIVRNIACALFLTKLLTNPMQGWFQNSPSIDSKMIVGSEAEICSLDATPEHGQAKFKTDAAPLLLNVRTDGPHLPKGTRVWITYYDRERRIYLVSPTTTSTHSHSDGISS